MKKNMGSVDRIIRVMIAVVIFTLYYIGSIQGTAGIILLVVGVVLLLTSIIGFCPLYLPFGLHTLRKKLSQGNQN